LSGASVAAQAASEAAAAQKHAQAVAATANAEAAAGAQRAAVAEAAVAAAKQAMRGATAALQDALRHDGDLEEAQQGVAAAFAQHAAAKDEAAKRQAGAGRLRDAAAKAAAKAAAPIGGSAAASSEKASRRVTRSLARSASSGFAASRSFFHACRLYDPDHQLRRVEVEECRLARLGGSARSPGLGGSARSPGEDDDDDDAFHRFKECSAFVRLRMDALSAAADERFLPPEDPTLDPDGAGLLSVGAGQQLWLPAEDQLLLRAVTQRGSKAQEHWLSTGALPFNLLATEVLAATKAPAEVEARVASFEDDHPLKKALAELDEVRAYHEQVSKLGKQSSPSVDESAHPRCHCRLYLSVKDALDAAGRHCASKSRPQLRLDRLDGSLPHWRPF
jgi:hypothetical protein